MNNSNPITMGLSNAANDSNPAPTITPVLPPADDKLIVKVNEEESPNK